MIIRTLMRLIACTAMGLAAGAPFGGGDFAAHAAPPAVAPLPARLSETGLYAEESTEVVRAGNIEFSPQYPLWSDGMTKRRRIHLPPGTAIDAAELDAWTFPPGTRLWARPCRRPTRARASGVPFARFRSDRYPRGCRTGFRECVAKPQSDAERDP
jgi:hypothetical protein